jgi:hypothetical protein
VACGTRCCHHSSKHTTFHCLCLVQYT